MVQEIKKDKNVLNKVDGFMNKVYDTPEVFVGSTSKIKDSMTDVMSNLYQLAKKNETIATESETDALDSLVTKDFDSEQIWAQIQLLNDPVLSELESKINSFMKSKEDLDIIKPNASNKRKIQYDEEDDEEAQDDDNSIDLDGLTDDYEGSEDEEQELYGQDEDISDEDALDQDEDASDIDEDDEDKVTDEDDLQDEDSLDEGIDSDSIKSTKSTKSTTSTKSTKNNKKNGNNIDFLDVKEMEKFLDDEDDNEYQRREDEENDEDDLELGDSEEEDGGLDLPEVEMDEEERELDSMLDKYMEKNQMELQSTKSTKSTKKSNGKDAANMKFEDFFADPDQDQDEDDDDFGLDHDDYDGEDEDQDEGSLEDEEDGQDSGIKDDDEDQEPEEEESEAEAATLPEEELSAFQKKAARIQERIKKLEQENLKKKDWTMIGETSAKERPLDSLLGESLDYEHTQKVAPTITEDTNKSIEDIIKKRILEKNFDDVIRKTEKEFKDNYKKKVEISDEKSQEGLGEVYEKSYMKQVLGVEETDQLKQKHIKIYELFNKLCYKLDSLTNFQYTPKMIKNKELNITTASAVTMEEKVPVAASTSTMIAPEEVYFKKNADEKGESELTKEDRSKIRKAVKKQWSHEKEEKDAQERLKEKTDPNYAKKTSESKAMAQLKQAKNVTIVDTSKSQVKSGDTRSGSFFKTIHTHEENRKKGIEDPNSLKSKKKQKLDSISSKQFKL